MGLFDRFLSKPSDGQPAIRFGRYTDSYKLPVNYEAWDLALTAFEEERYLDSFRFFLQYLRDETEDNVRYWEENDHLRFELYQGSKKLLGFANDKKLKAVAKVARTDNLNVGFMRRLLEANFGLKYSRFALDEEKHIVILFDTYTLDGSPYKLYYALKEAATNADKQDDLLLDEFKMLQQVDAPHLEPLPQNEKDVKYQFIHDSIAEVLREVESGNLGFDQYPGGYAYLLLDLIYKLDYLTKPEGYMMESLERAHRLYFAKDDRSTLEKNQQLIRQLQRLAERPREEFFKEMYQVRSTFGITTPVTHERVVSFIDGELGNMDWYLENGHLAIARAIPSYIIGYCLFNFAIPKPGRDLFHLYFQIMEPGFFRSLGFDLPFNEHQKLHRRSIKRAIDQILDDNRWDYPNLQANTRELDFQSECRFARSFLLMVRNMEMNRKH